MTKRSFINKKDFLLISIFGIEFALIMSLGAFGGRWLDEKLNTSPWFLLIASIFAFAFAMFILIVHAKAATKRPDKTEIENKK